jgi:hypothetical protein
MVRTTIAGQVVDESGMPMQGVPVAAHGRSAITNKYGHFVLTDVTAPQNRAVVMAKQDGYFTASAAAMTKANGLTEVRLNMMSYGTRKSVNGATGGTLTVSGPSGTASVKFEANGMTVNGQPYTGEARVALRYLDPADPTFPRFFPGDEAAIRENGDNTMLVTYGVLRVDMRTPSGEVIQPADGKPATLSYPVPSNRENAPSSIPLWYFDETEGIWKEEGLATKQGNAYVGTVKHFTDWNLDVPDARFALLKGKVVCNGRALAGVIVDVGERQCVTDENGEFERRVPIDITFDVMVRADQNEDLYSSDVIEVGPFNDRETPTITIPITSGCPATITGTLENSSGTKIPGTLVWDRGNGRAKVYTTIDGDFEMIGPPNTSMSIVATSWACGTEKPFETETGAAESVSPIGNIVVCSNEPTEGDIDISSFVDLSTRAVLSPNGENVVIVGRAPVIVVRNAMNGTLVSTTPFSSDSTWLSNPHFSADGSRYIVTGWDWRSRIAIVVETNTGSIIRQINNVDSAILSSDGQSVFGMQQGSFVQISVATGDVTKTFDIGSQQKEYRLAYVSADETKAILFDYSNTFYHYDMTTEQFTGQFSVQGSNIFIFRTSAGGERLAYVESNTRRLTVLDLSNGNKISVDGLIVPPTWTYDVALHPTDNVVLFQPENSGTPALIDFTTGDVAKLLATPEDAVEYGSVSISADGKRASAVYKTGSKLMLRVWDL